MTTPLSSVDPTAGLYLPTKSPAVPLRYRSGRVLSWSASTGESVVDIDGETFENLPVSPGTYVGLVKELDAVSLLSTTDERGITTYCIVGLSITPPDNRIGEASGLLGYAHEFRDFGSAVADATGSWGDLAGFIGNPLELAAISPLTVIEITISLTAYGGGSAMGFDVGATIDGGADNRIGGIRLATGNSSSHTAYTFVGVMPTGSAGTKSIQPRWRNISGGTTRMDANDMVSVTARETFKR
jgi:hypothetical protein